MSLPWLVMTTVGSADDARAIARQMVERRLAACAQISAIESIYRWQGRVEQEPEYRLLFKTRAERYAELQDAIRALHPYELPAIHAVPTAQAWGPYADWVAQSSTPDAEAPASN
jgi:periplasmic divalent cation tolerance protein